MEEDKNSELLKDYMHLADKLIFDVVQDLSMDNFNQFNEYVKDKLLSATMQKMFEK